MNGMADHVHTPGGCECKSANTTVHQTIDEMGFERGIWTAGNYDGEPLFDDKLTGCLDSIAAMDNDSNKVKKFIQSGQVDARDNFGYTALHYTARLGLLDMCTLLLDGGAAVDSRTKTGGVTPLQRAALKGRIEVVELLVHRGADVRLQDVDGKTALHRAMEGPHQSVIDYLLAVDASLAEIADNHQETPMLAAQRSR